MWSAWAEFYGAVVPSGNKTQRHFGPVFEAFAVAQASGLAAVFVTLALCVFSSFRHRNVVNVICLGLLAFFFHMMSTRRRGLMRFPVGLAGLLALINGMLLGSYGYSTYGYFVMKYSRSRTYPSVDPYQRAATVVDGGRLVFAAEARLVADKAAGHIADDGSIYCAAPILGLDEPSSVEFWAVGEGCCEPSGSFTCGDGGDSTARGGAVVFGGPGGTGGGPLTWLITVLSWHGAWTPQEADTLERAKYDAPRKMAEEALGLASKGHDAPVYVRWMRTSKLQMLASDCTTKAWVFIFLATFVYACISAPVAWLASRRAATLFRHHVDPFVGGPSFSPPRWG